MQNLPSQGIFDTIYDTTKKMVSMKTSFYFRQKKGDPEKGLIYLRISGNGRERINIHLDVRRSHWDNKREIITADAPDAEMNNLLLANWISRVTEIKTRYFLENKVVTPQIIRDELSKALTRVNFVAFFAAELDDQRSLLSAGTYARYGNALNKLNDYRPEVLFSTLRIKFFLDYRAHLQEKGNGATTINSNIKVLKTFLYAAQRKGITIPVNIEDIVAGSTLGNRTYLTPLELATLFRLLFSNFLNPGLKLVCSYFLFDCMTGLRIGDLLRLTRKQVVESTFSFRNQKSKKDQTMAINRKAREILDFCPDLFVKRFSEKHLNEEIKKIMRLCGIDKSVSFHVGRHTFATCFLRAGGKVEELQKLLKHQNIADTMIYVHLLEEEANQKVYLLDDLLDSIELPRYQVPLHTNQA